MNLGYPAVAGPVLAAASSAWVADTKSIAVACNRLVWSVGCAIGRVVAPVHAASAPAPQAASAGSPAWIDAPGVDAPGSHAAVAVQGAKGALRLPRTAADEAPAGDNVAIEPRTVAVHAAGERCTLALAATPGHWPVARRVDAREAVLQNGPATQPVLDP